MTKKILARNKLKQIDFSTDFENAKTLIYETAKSLNWNLTEKDHNILIFKTDFGPLMDWQYITIILTPSKTILFNSSPHNIGFGYHRARFEDNFNNFQYNFDKIEKQ